MRCHSVHVRSLLKETVGGVGKRDVDAGLSNATQTGTNATCCGQGFQIADLVNLGPDLMGMALLKGGGDPNETAVRDALPGFVGGQGQVAAFVGSRKGPAYPLTREHHPTQFATLLSSDVAASCVDDR